MTCCRRWQTGGFIRMWCRLAATIYPVAAPYIIFSIPTDVAGDVFCGQAESTLRIQVDVWAETNDEARALRLDALARLQVLSPVEVTKIPGYDTTTHLHRATLEITVIA
jgi:hypothetical protein